MNFIVLFALCTAVNVILSTIRSLTTINGGKWTAAAVNAITYGFYTWVIVLTADDGMAIWIKMLITAVCNFVCVYIVKYFEERVRKTRLWEIKMTVPASETEDLHKALANIPHNFIEGVGKYTVFNCYCYTKEQSDMVKDAGNRHYAKFFVSENKFTL